MWSVDGCNQGVPFSYATGPYSQADNTFLISNYNNWYSSLVAVDLLRVTRPCGGLV